MTTMEAPRSPIEDDLFFSEVPVLGNTTTLTYRGKVLSIRWTGGVGIPSD